jgi:hypothetical protein
MTIAEAQTLALKVLKQVMEEKLDENNVQLAQVSFSSTTVVIPYWLSRLMFGGRTREAEKYGMKGRSWVFDASRLSGRAMRVTVVDQSTRRCRIEAGFALKGPS